VTYNPALCPSSGSIYVNKMAAARNIHSASGLMAKTNHWRHDMSRSLWRKIINITKNIVSSSVEDSQQLQTWHRCNRKSGFMSYIRILRVEYLWILLPTMNTCTYRHTFINYHSRFLSPARNRSPNHGSSSPNSGHCTDVKPTSVSEMK